MGKQDKNKKVVITTEKQIQEVLHKRIIGNPRFELDNLYVFNWESDYMLITPAGYIYEVEIKVSRRDYKNDFIKREKHAILSDSSKVDKPHYFYYAVPKGLITRDEVPDYAGLIYIENKRVFIVKSAPKLHKVKMIPESMGLLDKFYYNMINAKTESKNQRNKAESLAQRFKDVFRKEDERIAEVRKTAILDFKDKAMSAFMHACPHFSIDDKYIVTCSKTKQTRSTRCRMNCPEIDKFWDNLVQ